MLQQTIFSVNQINLFKQYLVNHGDYDWLQMDWQNEAVLTPLLGKEPDTLLPILKAYQRLLRIIPKEYQNLAVSLLERGMHSAVQIASFSNSQFLELTRDLVPNQPEVLEMIYKYAQLKRSQLVVQYMDLLQNHEPHVQVARI